LGVGQVGGYIIGLVEAFHKIKTPDMISITIQSEPALRYCTLYQQCFFYWRGPSNGDIGILTVMHDRMHPTARFRENLRLRRPPPDRMASANMLVSTTTAPAPGGYMLSLECFKALLQASLSPP
jgi:hypothetical protein